MIRERFEPEERLAARKLKVSIEAFEPYLEYV